MRFGSVKDRIICKLEWLLKKVVEACCKGGQAATSQVHLMYGLYTDDFIDAWVINPVMVECFVDLKGCGRKGSGLLYKERLRAGVKKFSRNLRAT